MEAQPLFTQFKTAPKLMVVYPNTLVRADKRGLNLIVQAVKVGHVSLASLALLP
jgi:hypothetical protein